jgi:hypothetical protein
MSLLDMFLAVCILAAAGWLLYRSLFKNKGGCAGCSGCSCSEDRQKGKDRLVRLSKK